MLEELAKLLTVENGLLVTILGGAYVYFTKAFNRLETHFRQDMASMEARMDERFKQVDARFDKVDERFDRIDARFNRL